MSKDVLREFVERLLEAVSTSGQGFSDHLAREIERQIREDFGGERVHICKNAWREERREAVLDAIKRGQHPEDAARAHGVSRSLAYEIYRRRNEG